ncbi:hypothetical protein BTN49_1903 [Candidatus Enterovibrio escicola]|uniref:Mobile element protein n=1 Tax=Candidatus Enterovibrio escicola TaxID=1927127 RepID=A0A2A5T2X0_9GAMM|nr:hypothetical protein BTN49_1903 [Candidatus Enterovibrio escacola]
MYTHEVIAEEVSLVFVGNNEVLFTLFNPLRGNIQQAVLMEPMTYRHVTMYLKKE